MKNLLLFTVLILFTLIVRGQDTFTITLMNNSLVQFCKDPVPIIISASNLEIGGTHPVEGMKISFTGGYIQGEDYLKVAFTDASTLASSWSWNFGDSIASTVQNPIHDYTFTGRHTVFLKVTSDLNCSDSVSHQLLVAFDRLFPPNGFSPNAPNRIDRAFLLNAPGIRPVGYHFKVLSRWDDIVFEAKDEIAGWDGRMKNGSFAPA